MNSRPSHLCRAASVAMLAFLFLAPCRAAEALPSSFSPGLSPGAPWTHRPSGFSFPEKVAGFVRGDAHQYDPSGDDVSVAYDFDHPSVVATFYVYPTGGLTLEQEFARRQKEITDMYPEAKLVVSDSVDITPKKLSALRAVYAIPRMFKGMDEPMRSVLLVGQRGKNFVEYRISHPLSGGETAEEAARRFCQDMAWPEARP